MRIVLEMLRLPDATENGKRFVDLISKYRRLFDESQTAQYQIVIEDILQFTEDQSVVVKGRFEPTLTTRSGDTRRWNGRLSMRLLAINADFRVESLEYGLLN